jgi:hypothetical protein
MKSKQKEMAKKLASYAEVYVNDALERPTGHMDPQRLSPIFSRKTK